MADFQLCVSNKMSHHRKLIKTCAYGLMFKRDAAAKSIVVVHCAHANTWAARLYVRFGPRLFIFSFD